jgi:hypothetical protein
MGNMKRETSVDKHDDHLCLPERPFNSLQAEEEETCVE